MLWLPPVNRWGDWGLGQTPWLRWHSEGAAWLGFELWLPSPGSLPLITTVYSACRISVGKLQTSPGSGVELVSAWGCRKEAEKIKPGCLEIYGISHFKASEIWEENDHGFRLDIRSHFKIQATGMQTSKGQPFFLGLPAQPPTWGDANKAGSKATQLPSFAGSIPGLGRSPAGGHSHPLPYSCLENPMDRGAWWASVYKVTESQTRLKLLGRHAPCS